MPELPEITVIAGQMKKEIVGKSIADIEVMQPKNLNVPVPEFTKTLKGKIISDASAKGKWIFIKLHPAYFVLINLGMGGELLYFTSEKKLPEKRQFKLSFRDGTGFTLFFWWFGYIHLVPESGLQGHRMTAKLGISPTEEGFSLEFFKELLGRTKTGVKSFLLDQKNVAGIGNVYIQDILFEARLHPNRRISTLSDKEKENLYNAIRNILSRSIKMGGLAYEKDFYGHNGGFTGDEFVVGYREGKPCPVCGARIEKIKTGSTSSYVCPRCQTL